MEKFSDILKDLIEEKGKSLRQLAIDSGVSANQYSKYLRGSFPTLEVAVKIANYFNCSLDYLFGLTETFNHDKYRSKDVELKVFVPRYLKELEYINLSHYKFSQLHNVSESNLRHWQYGDVPKIETLIFLSKNLSTSIDYLVGRIN
ncbi:MAG: helix-turn-helix transcriptional regulator [Clostridia bacterium]|nr:helix-turn-helix transcriptional regulator [Clostridia bacterium]